MTTEFENLAREAFSSEQIGKDGDQFLPIRVS